MKTVPSLKTDFGIDADLPPAQDGSIISSLYEWPSMRPQQIETPAGEFSRQKLLEREILEIADRERRHIGRELHDGLCQSLTGIAALCSVLSRSLAVSGRSGPAAAASEIVRLLNEAIGEARDIAHGLSGIGLTGADLVGELETLARIASNTYFASCTFTWDRRCPRLDVETETHLIRIAQEAVRNAFTHGRADEVDISLECADGFGRLSIRDNGIGLSLDDANHRGIGLHTMDYRAGAIGGSLTIARRPEGGTVVVCAFDLQTHELRDGRADALG
jgi:signal transduction histidine kinase